MPDHKHHKMKGMTIGGSKKKKKKRNPYLEPHMTDFAGYTPSQAARIIYQLEQKRKKLGIK